MTTRAAIARPPQPKAWEITELELEEPKAHEVRVKVMAAGLCHSDDHITHGDAPIRLPVVGGHEGAGVVESVGPDVQRVKPGDKVVLSYIPACGACRPCSTGHSSMCVKGLNAGTGMFEDGTWRFHGDREGETDIGGFCTVGSFSQYTVVSEYATVPLRIDFQDIPWEVLCLTGCGVPTGWGSSVYAAGVRAGDTAVIFGAGGVGSNAVQGARFAGAQHVVVVDPVEFKREMAVSVFGATKAFATAAEAHDYVKEVTWGQLADKVILTPDAVTEEMLNAAVNMTGKGGKVQVTAVGHFGEKNMTFRAGLLIGYHRQVRGALAGDSNLMHDIPKLLSLYKSGQLKLDELVTRKYALDEINRAYADMHDGKNIRGVIIHEH
ncbi:MAG: NDMA-dependent alcohol dehydrogenase [Nocardiopsaceae bacterium]|nr:NDMA-dependent alcohol dehydrogenase [Nocardiopsaceae bacterium]